MVEFRNVSDGDFSSESQTLDYHGAVRDKVSSVVFTKHYCIASPSAQAPNTCRGRGYPELLTASVRSLLGPRVKLVALVLVTASSFRVSFLTLVGFEFYSTAPNIVRENNTHPYPSGLRVGE
jgi:hypothetical protein